MREARVLPARGLFEVFRHLSGEAPLDSHVTSRLEAAADETGDLKDVRGQHRARRSLEIAASGGHHLLMIGPPGTGKSMLALRLPGILAAMNEAEALEAATVLSVADRPFDASNWAKRPFRAPHHSASAVALVGGGAQPRPGEISLAHQGILFLDELAEFNRHVLEVLRQPLESGWVTISRAARSTDFPARFQLVCAMNPCPCGHFGDGTERCRCTPAQRIRYASRVSGPLLDRLDLIVETLPWSEDIQGATSIPGECTAGGRRARRNGARMSERAPGRPQMPASRRTRPSATALWARANAPSCIVP